MIEILIIILGLAVIAIWILASYTAKKKRVRRTPAANFIVDLVIGGILPLGLLIIAFGIVAYAIKPVHDPQWARSEANRLIARAGGPARVLDDAKQVFKRFGTAEPRPLFPSDLKVYPALSALSDLSGPRTTYMLAPAMPDGIMPSESPRILVGVGTRIKGFVIEIKEGSSSANCRETPNSIEVAPNIVVHY